MFRTQSRSPHTYDTHSTGWDGWVFFPQSLASQITHIHTYIHIHRSTVAGAGPLGIVGFKRTRVAGEDVQGKERLRTGCFSVANRTVESSRVARRAERLAGRRPRRPGGRMHFGVCRCVDMYMCIYICMYVLRKAGVEARQWQVRCAQTAKTWLVGVYLVSLVSGGGLRSTREGHGQRRPAAAGQGVPN